MTISQIISFFVTCFVNAAIGIALFFSLIIVLNGFSERDATWGIYLYIGLALIASLVMGVLASIATATIVRRGKNATVACLISILGFSVIGGIIKVALVFVGVIAAEIARNAR